LWQALRLQPVVFTAGGPSDREIQIGLLPEPEEVLVRLPDPCHIRSECYGARLPKVRERIQHRQWRFPPVGEDLLTLDCGCGSSPESQAGLAAQILRPEFGGGFVAGG